LQRGRVKHRGAQRLGVDPLDHARQHLARTAFDDRAQAERAQRAAVDAATRSLGARHMSTLMARGDLALTMSERGEHDAARRAFEGPWSRFTPAQRQQVIIRFAELFEKNFEELTMLASGAKLSGITTTGKRQSTRSA
jgi:delta 1-pyrroline-5-carboxylate dehydrogenase